MEEKMRLAEVVDSPKSAQEFIDYNHITPREIIVIWDEDWDDDSESTESVKESKNEINNRPQQKVNLVKQVNPSEDIHSQNKKLLDKDYEKRPKILLDGKEITSEKDIDDFFAKTNGGEK